MNPGNVSALNSRPPAGVRMNGLCLRSAAIMTRPGR